MPTNRTVQIAATTHAPKIIGAMFAFWIGLAGCGSGDSLPAIDGSLSDGASADSTLPSTDAAISSDGAAPLQLENKIYVSFILNVHDWVNLQNSIDTLNRVLDLHEQYQVPCDFYLTDAMVQRYETQAPALLTRLRTSPYVAISYHLRPPTPYYTVPDFDTIGVASMTGNTLLQTLTRYEEHELDLSTGLTTAKPGGYEHLKNLMGYPPYVVVGVSGNSQLATTLASVYRSKGAKFTLVHGTDSTFGSKTNGLFYRPEDFEIKAYENKNSISVEQVLSTAIAALPVSRPMFANLKWHDDNFNYSGTPWINVFYADGEMKSQPRTPPYDLAAIGTLKVKTQSEKNIQWARYEALLQYVVARPATYAPINSREIVRYLPAN